MTDDELRALLNRSTPGPWVSEADGRESGGFSELAIKGAGSECVVNGCGCCGSPYGDNAQDVRLMAMAPELAAEVLRLRAQIAALPPPEVTP